MILKKIKSKCLPANEKIWVLNKKNNKFQLISIKLLYDTFKCNDYYVVSLNKETKQAEFKKILKIEEDDNYRPLVTLKTNKGQEVTTTVNHHILTIKDNQIGTELAEDIKRGITLSTVIPPSLPSSIDLNTFGENYNGVENITLDINEDLATFLGLYCSSGEVFNNEIVLYVNAAHDVNKYIKIINTIFNTNSIHYELIKYRNMYVKRIKFKCNNRYIKFIQEKCGCSSRKKKVPTEIIFASENIKIAFIKGFIDTYERQTKHNLNISTFSEDLYSHLLFLLHSLHIYPSVKHNTQDSPFLGEYFTLFSLEVDGETCYKLGLNIDMPILGKNLGEKRGEEIKEVEFVDRMFTNSDNEYVYDICVEDNANFLTRDCIFVHNSDCFKRSNGSSTLNSPPSYGIDKNEIIEYQYGTKKIISTVEELWEKARKRNKVKKTKFYQYIKLENVNIKDSKTNKYIKCNRIWKKIDRGDWVKIKLENGEKIIVTEETYVNVLKKGKIKVKDVGEMEEVFFDANYRTDGNINIDLDIAWLMGYLFVRNENVNNLKFVINGEYIQHLDKANNILKNKFNEIINSKIEEKDNDIYLICENTKFSLAKKLDIHGKYRILPPNILEWNKKSLKYFVRGMQDAGFEWNYDNNNLIEIKGLGVNYSDIVWKKLPVILTLVSDILTLGSENKINKVKHPVKVVSIDRCHIDNPSDSYCFSISNNGFINVSGVEISGSDSLETTFEGGD